MVWLFVACVGSSPTEEAPPDPKRGDSLVIALARDPGHLNPVTIETPSAFSISFLVNPGLTMNAGGFEPALAESWEWSEDGASLTYHLRDGLRWEDGTPLTSHDVVFTWSLIANPDVASFAHGSTQHIERVEAIDDQTVRYHFRTRRNPVLQQGLIRLGVVNKALFAPLDPASLRGHETARHPFASGPFRLTAWDPDQRIVLEPNPFAPAEWRPNLDRIIARIIPEYTTRIIELERGNVDLVEGIDVEDIARLRALPHVRLVRDPIAAMVFLGYNSLRPPFDDLRVREAMTLAIDRDKLIQRMLGAEGEVYGSPCVGTVSPRLSGWVPEDLQPLPYDPAGASQRLAAAGFQDTDGDGWLERNGQAFQFTVMIQSDAPESKEMAVWMQAQLQEVGVNIRFESVESSHFFQRALGHDFDALIGSFAANPIVDLSRFWRSDSSFNVMSLADPRIDALIDQGVEAHSVPAAQEAFKEAQRLIYAAQPATFLYWSDNIHAVDRRFRDVESDFFTLFSHAERWWVPPEERKY